MTADQWANASFKGEVTSVAINSPPVVNFKVTDAAGKPVVGLGSTSKSSTATVASYPNLAFALAKLVPGTTSSPSKWVSYIVTTVPTTTTALTASRPSNDNTGTLLDNGDGSYKYTFYRDITTTKAVVAGLTLASPSVAADLGDLTYEPNLTHRLVIQLSGNAPGTGSNTADGSTVTPGVAMANPANIIYDFIPATGNKVAVADLQREVVAIDSCNSCHEKLAFHGGGRVDTRYCVVCHTDQRKFGYANVASVAGKFPLLTEKATVNATTGITSYSYTPETRVADGEVSGNFPILVHKIHNGAALVKDNYNYANVAFNNKAYSMLDNGQKMCSTCHDNTKAAQADNWSTKPSRLACGSCHDGINFATGGGSTLADKAAATAPGAVMATSGHALVGLPQTSDAACAICHDAAAVKVQHQTDNVTKHNPTIAAGLKTFTYDILSAAVDATTNDVTIKFKVSADGTPVTYLAPTATMADPLSGFTGSPSFMLAYALTQDGVATPVDYNNAGVKQAQAITVSIANLLNTTKTSMGSLSATADASGYYTATLKGDGPLSCGGNGTTTGPAVKCVFPVGAKLRAVALQGYFTQVVSTGNVARHAISVVKAVTGDTARRTVVDPAKCSNCHEWFEGHGGNRVYQTQVCVMCHTPGLASSGRGISDTALAAYPFTAADLKKLNEWSFDKTLTNGALKFPVTSNDFKDMIHGIHSGRERVTPFVDARDRTSTTSPPGVIQLLSFKRMDFPGKLNSCETCHVTGTAAATTYNTVPLSTLASTHESIDTAYASTPTTVNAKAALSTANLEDKVTTPFAAACVSCHDSAPAQAHIRASGGQIQVARSALALNNESCATCHGPGKAEDTAVVHK